MADSRYMVLSGGLTVVSCMSLSFIGSAPQVLDVGVTRLLVKRLVRIWPHICRNGSPVAGGPSAVFRAAAIGLKHLHQRSKACRTPPGYASRSFFSWAPTFPISSP